MTKTDWKTLAAVLHKLLGLQCPSVAITLTGEAPSGVPAFDAPMALPTPDGRTGRVSAGCAFWIEAGKGTFVTAPEDHGNCSLGCLTHGLKTIEEVAGNSDIAALLESGWVSPDMVPRIPVVKERPNYITYGPLGETAVDPDVILLRINAKQAMVINGAVPGVQFEGKPQCHIVPIAKEHDQIAISVGCMLSRVRTGLSNNEMICAIPARRLAEVIDLLKRASAADKAVAAYASEDGSRFRTRASSEC